MVLTPILEIVYSLYGQTLGKYNNPQKVWQGFFAWHVYLIGYRVIFLFVRHLGATLAF
jgi:quinol-cytochrome oxidoreductase complex cytochrome b subunit